MHSALFLMSSQQQSYISLYPMIHELHTAEFSCKTCARQDICLYVHSETAKALWWGTEGLFDSYSEWGCLVCQIPSEGLFHWVCSLCIALRLQEGEPKQAVCVLTEDQSLQLLTVPAEHSFRKPSSPVTLPTHHAQYTHVHRHRETESVVQLLKQKELCNTNGRRGNGLSEAGGLLLIRR